MHEVAVVASFAGSCVVFPADRVSEVGNVGQVAVDGPFVEPAGVEAVAGPEGVLVALEMDVDVASEVVVAVLADNHRPDGSETAGFDVHVLVELVEA